MRILFTFILFTLTGNSYASGFFLPPTEAFAQLRSNLYIVAPDKSTVLMDGTLTQYDVDYSNELDGKDGRKMFNPSENFGMVRGSTVLIVERRAAIANTDSIFFKMWNMRIITYQLELITVNLNMEGRTAVLEDKYLNESTPVDLNGKTYIHFSVTSDPASKAPDRFRIIFQTGMHAAIPFTFTSIKAAKHNNGVSVDWKTLNEDQVQEFDIERSIDGKLFRKVSSVRSGNLPVNQYSWVDENPADGNNFYRVSGIGNEGKQAYTEVMQVFINKGKTGISVYPNPATSSNLNLKMVNQPSGKYEVRIINSFGQTFMVKTVEHTLGKAIENISPAQKIPTGIYRLQVTSPTGEKIVMGIVF